MTKRILTGIIGAAIFLFLIVRGGDLLAAAVAVIITAGVWEYHRLAAATGVETSLPLLLALNLSYFTGRWLSLRFSWFPGNGLPGVLFLACIFTSFLLGLKKNKREGLLLSTAANLLGLVYPGILLTYIIMIRAFPPPLGMRVLVLTFLIIWINDTGAYFTGYWLGRRKLAPSISPGKTIEGAAGGLIAGTAGGILFGFPAGLPVPWLLVVSVLVSLLGQVGDLFESLLKRGAGLKDSGTVLPGHGGVLDRFDSSLFTLPLVHYFLHFL